MWEVDYNVLGRYEVVSWVKTVNTQLHMANSMSQYAICPTPSVASQHNRKTPKFSVFRGDPTQKGKVSFEQRAFEVKSVMQSHMWRQP